MGENSASCSEKGNYLNEKNSQVSDYLPSSSEIKNLMLCIDVMLDAYVALLQQQCISLMNISKDVKIRTLSLYFINKACYQQQ